MNEIVKKNGINFGVIIGVFSILVTTLLYVIDLKLFVNMWIGLISLAIYITIGVILLSKTKKQLNNSISFKDAFTTYFLAAVIGTTLSVLFNIVLFNYVDPAAKDTLKEITIKTSVEMMEKFNAPAASINESIANMQKADNYSPSSQLLGMLTSFVISAVFGLILALIFRTKTSHRE